MFIFQIYICLLALVGGVFGTPSDSVVLCQGTVVGTSATYPPQNVQKFLGIPYAEPVTRFQPASKVAKSTATIQATAYGTVCPQASTPGTGLTQGENCLSINVYRAANVTNNAQLPVAVYIHGGGFNSGYSGGRDLGNMVAYASSPFIAVSMNYRLGAFGFLDSGVAARTGALNLGLKDQILALHWVQDNIAAFGGDVTKVTIWGDSAGGHSVGHHLQTPLTKGLFSKAIMESGAPTARFCQPPGTALAEEQFQELLNLTGIQSANMNDSAIMSALSKVNISSLTSASSAVYNTYSASIRWPWQPVIDGSGGVIPEAPLSIWSSGNWNKVPILTGFCYREGSSFVPNLNTSAQFTNFFHVLNPNLTTQDLSTLNNLYPDPLTTNNNTYKQLQAGRGPEFTRVAAAYGEFAYISPVRHTANFSASAASNPPVYLYEAAYNLSVLLGSGHDCAGSYVLYEKSKTDFSTTQKAIAASVNEYWTSFIVSGDPNKIPGKAPSRPTWPTYANNVANKLVVGRGNDEIAGGNKTGVVARAVKETEFVTTGNFWWSKVAGTESS